jgi:hypothetical protein
MIDIPLEADWQMFKKHVPVWREQYLNHKNESIAALLLIKEESPTERFWNAKKMIKEDSYILSSCLDQFSRSKMTISLSLMIRYGLIEEPNLEVFSDELKEQILAFGR